MKVYMITGDNKHSALKVAKHVSIEAENVTYEAYPETNKKYSPKSSKLRKLRNFCG